MAERERLTNRERREQAREERKAREAEAARKKKRGNLRTGLVTFAIVAVVAVVLLQAFTGGPESIDERIELVSSEVEDARLAAGCELITDGEPLEDRSHVESESQLDPDAVYTDTRPTHSGPHTVNTHPVTASADSQIAEQSSTHNIEHGAVIAWWDPEQVEDGTASEIGSWAEQLNDNGFGERSQAGVGILTAPYEDPGISSGKAIAFRAWGVAMDCDSWDQDVANGFVLDHFGTHGIGPERTLAQFPTDVLAYADQETGDTTSEEAPLDEGFENLDAEVPAEGDAEPSTEAPADDTEAPADDAEAPAEGGGS